MDFLDELIDDIKTKYTESIQESELENYKSKYRDYYAENVIPVPKGFFSAWAWETDQSKNFDEKFNQLGLQVIKKQSEPPHDYSLEERGMGRLRELQQKIKQS